MNYDDLSEELKHLVRKISDQRFENHLSRLRKELEVEPALVEKLDASVHELKLMIQFGNELIIGKPYPTFPVNLLNEYLEGFRNEKLFYVFENKYDNSLEIRLTEEGSQHFDKVLRYVEFGV